MLRQTLQAQTIKKIKVPEWGRWSAMLKTLIKQACSFEVQGTVYLPF